MLPLVDKPVVQYVVEELARAGIERVLFVTGRRKRAIEDHFDADPELEHAGPEAVAPASAMEILYTRQPRPRGLGDALRHAEGFAAGRPVVVALGDSIIEPPGIATRLVRAYEEHGADAVLAVAEVPARWVSRYGIAVPRDGATGEVFEVADVIEKPSPSEVSSRTAVMGRYVLGPAIFSALAHTAPGRGGEIELADALHHVLASGGRVIAVALRPGERRHDIGTVESYCTAFLHYALSHPTLGEALRGQAAELLDDKR
jgi:UTP--glucose-1-phosphate uridylyltransferase